MKKLFSLALLLSLSNTYSLNLDHSETIDFRKNCMNHVTHQVLQDSGVTTMTSNQVCDLLYNNTRDALSLSQILILATAKEKKELKDFQVDLNKFGYFHSQMNMIPANIDDVNAIRTYPGFMFFPGMKDKTAIRFAAYETIIKLPVGLISSPLYNAIQESFRFSKIPFAEKLPVKLFEIEDQDKVTSAAQVQKNFFDTIKHHNANCLTIGIGMPTTVSQVLAKVVEDSSAPYGFSLKFEPPTNNETCIDVTEKDPM